MTLPRPVTLAVAPLAGVQGLRVRRRIPILPEAAGPTAGVAAPAGRSPAHVPAGTVGCPASLLVIGESTAAGCGVSHHAEGMAGALAALLADADDAPVRWRVVGRFGATARAVRRDLLPLLDREAPHTPGADVVRAAPTACGARRAEGHRAGGVPTYDLAVLLIGVNDLLVLRSERAWARDLASLIAELCPHATRLLVAGLPPMRSFGSLPRPLRDVLADHAEGLDAVSARVCGAGDAGFVSSHGLRVEQAFFARDGFHPSAAGYARWAALICEHARP